MTCKTNKTLVYFATTRIFIKAYRLLELKKIKIRVVTIPEAITSECGSCFELLEDQLEEVTCLLDDAGLEYMIYKI